MRLARRYWQWRCGLRQVVVASDVGGGWKGPEGIEGKPVSRRSVASVDDIVRYPTFHKSAGLTSTTVTSHSLVSCLIPITGDHAWSDSRVGIIFALRVGFREKPRFDFVTRSREHFAPFSSSSQPNFGFAQSRNSRSEFRPSPRGFTRPHGIVNRSRETSLLTDFGNHFIAHSLTRSKLNTTVRCPLHIHISFSQPLPRHYYLRVILQSREILHQLWFTVENNDSYDGHTTYFLAINSVLFHALVRLNLTAP